MSANPFDPTLGPRLLETLTEMLRQMETLNARSDTLNRQLGDAAQQARTGPRFTEHLTDNQRSIMSSSTIDPKAQMGGMNALRMKMNDMIGGMGEKISKVIPAGIRNGLKGVAGKAAGMLGLSLAGGGIMGLLMWGAAGKRYEAEWPAATQRMLNQFKQAGSIAGISARELGEDMRYLEENSAASRAEFAAVTGAMAALGIAAKEGMGDAEFSVDAMGRGLNKLVSVSLGLDKAFGQSVGTTATAAAKLVQNTNESMTRSITLVKNLGYAGQEAGMSFGMMQATIDGVTSSLRMQAVDAKELGVIMGKISQAYQSQGMEKPRAGALTSAGMQGLGGVIANLSAGFQVVLGKKIGKALGKDDMPWETAMIQMQRGFRDANGKANPKFMSTALTQIADLARGGDDISDDMLEVRLQQMHNMRPESTQAIRAYLEAKEGGMSDKDLEKKYGESVRNAFRDQQLTVNSMDRIMTKLKTSFLKIGAGLADIVITILKTIADGVLGIVALLTSWGQFGPSDEAVDAVAGEMYTNSVMMNDAIKRTVDGFKTFGGTLGEAGGAISSIDKDKIILLLKGGAGTGTINRDPANRTRRNTRAQGMLDWGDASSGNGTVEYINIEPRSDEAFVIETRITRTSTQTVEEPEGG